MYRYIRTSQVPLTVELAEEFANMPPLPGERPLRREHVEWLIGRIETGQFFAPRWAVAWLNGKKYRVNGQHSSTALTEVGGKFPTGVHALVDEFKCENAEDAAVLFAQFDPKQSTRTDGEIITAGSRTFASLDGIKPTTIILCVNCISSAFTYTGRYKGKMTAEMKRGLISDHIPFILWASEFVTVARLKVYGALAALYLTWEANPAKATEFWMLVRNETHPSVENPTRKLGQFLLLYSNGREFDRRRAKPWLPKQVMLKCIAAWNAWMRNEPTSLRVYEGGENDLNIAA